MAEIKEVTLAERDLKDWNPMTEDYHDRKFNSYREGLGYDIQSSGRNREGDGSRSIQLYVTGIPYQFDEVGLRSLFMQYGKVLTVCVPKSATGPQKYGFVTMASFRCAQAAIENLHKFMIQDCLLHVKVALTKEEVEKRKKRKEDETKFMNAVRNSTNGTESNLSLDKKTNGVLSSEQTQLNKVSGAKSTLKQKIPASPGAAGDSRSHLKKEMSAAVSASRQANQQVLQASCGRGRAPSHDTNVHALVSKTVIGQGLLQCVFCGQNASCKCARCKTRYCSKACQIKDWPQHKDKCEIVASELASSVGDASDFDVYVGEEIVNLNKEIFSTFVDNGCQSSESSEQFPHQYKSQQKSKANPSKKHSKCLFPTEGESQFCPSERRHLLPHPSSHHENRQTGPLLPTPTSYEDPSKIPHSYQERKRCPNNGPVSGQSQGQNQKIQDYKKTPQQRDEKTGPQNFSNGKKSLRPQQPSAQQTQQVPSCQIKEEMLHEEQTLKMKTADAAKPWANNSMIGKSVPSERKDKQPAVTISSNSQQGFVPESVGKECKKDMEQRLKVGDPVQVLVAHVESPASIWVQKLDELKTLAETLQTLKEHFICKKQEHLETVKSNDLCAASYQGDVCRARVIKVLGGHEAIIFFVDYGNTEKVSVSELLPLPPEMAAIPNLAIQCQLDISPFDKSHQWPEELTDDLRNQCTYGDKFTATALEQESDITVVMLIRNSDNLDVAQYLLPKIGAKAGMVKMSAVEDPSQRASVSPRKIFASEVKTVAQELQIGNSYSFLLMECTNPLNFYIQVNNLAKTKQFILFAKEIQHVYQTARRDIFSPEIGELVVAKFTADEQWYRAEVLDLDGTQAKVLYVDYGNSEMLELERLQPILPEHTSMPFQSCHGAVAGVSAPASQHWSPEQLQIFLYTINNYIEPLEDCAESKVFTAVVKGKEAGLVWVDIKSSHQEQTLSEILPSLLDEALLPQPLEPLHIPLSPICISSKPPSLIPSPASPQLSGSHDIPEKMTCAAQTLSPSSICSQTSKHSPSHEAMTGKPTSSHIFGDTNSAMLPPDFVNCGLTEISGCLDFYAVSLDAMEELETLRVALNSLAQDPQSTCISHKKQLEELVLVQFSVDKEWYRGHVLSSSADDATCKVLFIDYGNVEEKTVSSLRMLPKCFRQMEAKGIHCCLARLSPPVPSEVESTFLKYKQMQLKLKAVGDAGGKQVVEMTMLNGTSVNDLLINEKTVLGFKETESPSVPAPSELKVASTELMPSPGQDEGMHESRLTLACLSTAFPQEMESDMKAWITYSVDPGHFFCQTITQAAVLMDVTQALKQVDAEAPVTTLPEVGDLLCGKFEGEWYRCVVKQVLNETLCRVQYIDFGNESDIGLGDLRALPERFQGFPLSTFKCALYGVMPFGEAWAPLACKMLKSLELEHLTIRVQEIVNNIYHVTVLYGQEDLADTLLRQGLAQKESDFLQRQIEEMQARLAKCKK